MPIQWLVAGGIFLVAAAAWLAGHLLLRQRVAHGEFCPRCGQSAWHRRHRYLADHIFGVGLNIRRYRCANLECHWEGLRQKTQA